MPFAVVLTDLCSHCGARLRWAGEHPERPNLVRQTAKSRELRRVTWIRRSLSSSREEWSGDEEPGCKVNRCNKTAVTSGRYRDAAIPGQH